MRSTKTARECCSGASLGTWHCHIPTGIYLSTGVVTVGLFLCWSQPGGAQIRPDQTLERESSGVTQHGRGIIRIDGGANRGTYLFHSFDTFNVRLGERVYFSNPSGIDTILSRVTGPQSSNIRGVLGVDGDANLVLINPHGILFDNQARLDIRGSFLASTSPALRFDSGSEFSAIAPQAPPLLTINTPIGFSLTQPSTGTIQTQGILTAGRDLTLMANRLTVAGQVRADQDVLLQGTQQLQVFGGSIVSAGRDLVFRSPIRELGNATYRTGGYFVTQQGDGQVIDLLIPHDQVLIAEGDVQLADYTGPSLYILAGGQVRLGNTTITGTDSGQITRTITTGAGDPQQVTVLAQRDRPILDVRAGIDWEQLPLNQLNASSPSSLNTVFAAASGADITVSQRGTNGLFRGGLITNSGGTVFLSNQFYPDSSLVPGTIRVGQIDTRAPVDTIYDGGSITLSASRDISISRNLFSFTLSTIGNAGFGGAIARASSNYRQTKATIPHFPHVKTY